MVRMRLQRQSERGAVAAELQLGEGAKFFPTDAALAGWRGQVGAGTVEVVYEE